MFLRTFFSSIEAEELQSEFRPGQMTTFFVLIYNKGIIIRRRMFSIYACICVCACDFMPFEICSVLRTHPHAFSPYSYIYPIVMHTIVFSGD